MHSHDGVKSYMIYHTTTYLLFAFMSKFQAIIDTIHQETGHLLQSFNVTPVSGGSINEAYCFSDKQHAFFVKTNQADRIDMFAAEAAGLKALAAISGMRIPAVIGFDSSPQYSYLVLEYLPCEPLTSKTSSALGEQLAHIHHQSMPFFGWHRDNTIGSTAQYNPQHTDWVTFWITARLQPQLHMAKAQGYDGEIQTLGQTVITCLPTFFSSQPTPALLHGDLWYGNVACYQQQPLLFDPACYYGDSEADIAMTELFGGFDRQFYQAYHALLPPSAEYSTRKIIYNLYHVLNHLNLFGGHYEGQAINMMKLLIAQQK